jgi:two-component system sensor kinase FixL
VLHNLVCNAIDAITACGAGQGTIDLTATRDGDVLHICVSDSGPGIAPEMRERVFQPFATGKPEGMGLGLAISRSLVEAHGGKLWVEPTPEKGARFCFTIPFGL